MKPEYFLLAAVVLIAIIALARGSKKDKKARSGVFDLEIQYAAGPDEVDRLIYGTVTVSREVTRA